MKQIFFLLILAVSLFLLSACGVKSDPIPPATPAEMGRGKPAFHAEEENNTQVPRQKPKSEDEENDNN